jgi:hypothetical protein
MDWKGIKIILKKTGKVGFAKSIATIFGKN